MENKIKHFIKRKGLKTSFILSSTGVSKSYFYDVMKGKTIPSLVNARKIAKVMEVPLDELFPEARAEKNE
ncbi:helix-turn-helix transcriptional regulator [Alkaliphilus oremlandii]|uniref:Transcriptional regulator, XRE family n=1 Tax=Alkaliphilus oremlandii (strain OhILAs) TaxID=350688 RepID=A8MGA4_ALKOO|nr:helix-turn-helix transcriptional regulator [Alkaliphilus oremlandii]ABW18832.1 transcriptional regulator, XRE family [Alkaliphilus oremlandii OhILAs]